MGFCVPSGFSQRLLQKYASCWLNAPRPSRSRRRPELITIRYAERTMTATPNSTNLRRVSSGGANIDRHNSQFIRKLAVDVINSNPYVYGLTRSGRLVEIKDSKRQPHPSSRNGLKAAAQADLSRNSHRQRKPRPPPPDGLKTTAQAAAKLNCSIKTLNAHVAAGDLRYVSIGKGTKRQRRMFADPDINEFITTQTRKDFPCPSTRTETAARRISTSTSKCEVIGFTALRSRRPGAKPKR